MKLTFVGTYTQITLMWTLAQLVHGDPPTTTTRHQRFLEGPNKLRKYINVNYLYYINKLNKYVIKTVEYSS